ncbi:MAG: nitroreductase family protein [Anaerolineae bacterium]
MNVSEAIKTKRAVRMFKQEPVPQEVMEQILEAGRRSQSSKNSQPWQFIVIRERERLTALSQMGKFAGHIAGAAFAVVLVGAQSSLWNSFDLGQACAYLQLAAWELGVGTCIATIYDEAEAKALLGVPDEMSCYVALSFGYPAPDFVPAQMGGRRALSDVVRWEKW